MLNGGVLYSWAICLLFASSRVGDSLACAPTTPTRLPRMPTVAPATTTAAAPAARTTTPACGQCPSLPVQRADNSSRPVTLSAGTGADGCPTLTVDCVGLANDAATILTWFDASGTDIGSTFGSGTVTAVLQCNTNNQFVLPNGTVSSVECISG